MYLTCDYDNGIILTESEVHKMKDLQMIANECIRDLNAIGIYPHCKAKDFSVNTRAKSRWGQCKKRAINIPLIFLIGSCTMILVT